MSSWSPAEPCWNQPSVLMIFRHTNQHTRMRARSSESSLTIVFTVEYKIGLAQPGTPRRYHATNLSHRGQHGTHVKED